MIWDEINRNKRSSFFLLFLFSLLILLLGALFGLVFAGSYIIGLVIAFLIAVFYSLFAFYRGDKMILAMSNAKPVTRKDDPFLVNTVEGLAIAAGIPAPKIYKINETSINAFATGRDVKHASITVTSGARKRLNRQELEGVIAHEMSHIKNYDVRFMMLVVVLIGVVVLLSDFMLRSFLWGRGRRSNRGGGHLQIIIIAVALLLAILAPIIAQMIRFSISRKREYLADANAALLTRYPPGLASALKKIKNDHDKIVDTANKATAHLYIENPLRNVKGKMALLFNTHPPIDDRIRKLNKM